MDEINNIQYFEYEGTIHIDVEDITKKHKNQSHWKKTAMIIFDDDLCNYYSWFLFKRFNLTLTKPLRGSHLMIVNDDYNRDSTLPDNIKEEAWNNFKEKYNNTKIKVKIGIDYYTNGKHIWLIIPHIFRDEIHEMRKELGLSPKPYFGLHLTIGLATNQYNTEQLEYIHQLNEKNFIELH